MTYKRKDKQIFTTAIKHCKTTVVKDHNITYYKSLCTGRLLGYKEKISLFKTVYKLRNDMHFYNIRKENNE